MIDPVRMGLARLGWFGHGPWDSELEVVMFTSGLVLTHPATACERPCAIHDPSNHHMRHLPVTYRSDRAIVERICNHGVGHPDPDQVTYWQETLSETEAVAQSIHGCCKDRCCVAPDKGEDDND